MMHILLHSMKYEDRKWNICADLKFDTLLTELQCFFIRMGQQSQKHYFIEKTSPPSPNQTTAPMLLVAVANRRFKIRVNEVSNKSFNQLVLQGDSRKRVLEDAVS